MWHFIATQFLPPFILTCAVPGLLAVPLLTERKEINTLLFFIYAAIGGLFFQLIISFLVSCAASLPITPAVRILVVSGTVIALLAVMLRQKKGPMPAIRIGAYDIASGATILMMLAILHVHFKEITAPYFNAASDQYYWLAYAEASLHDATFVTVKIFTSQIHRPIFFLLLSPYVAFFPKDLDVYGNFMILWTYGIYTLIAIAIAELTRISLSRKMLGLMAVPMLFSLHWINYYLISGDIAPQGIAIFLFIAGFILFKNEKDLRILWVFLAVFYALHLGTLAVFALIIGMGTIISEGVQIVTTIFKKEKTKPAPWHFFKKIFFFPTAIVAILYALYASHVLYYFNPTLISYYDQYAEHLTLFSQPYLGREQEILLWGGVIGTLLAFLKNKRTEIAAGFAVPWALLITPLLAYHAFYASWQSFRYYLFLYPSAVILTLLIAEWGADGIALIASPRIGKGFIAVLTIGLLPVFVLAASNQQKMVFNDMIEGHDGGKRKREQYDQIKELLELAKSLHATVLRPITIIPKKAHSTYMAWAFAPRETMVLEEYCTEIRCPAFNSILPREVDFLTANPAMILVSKETESNEIEMKMLNIFPIKKELKDFSAYIKE